MHTIIKISRFFFAAGMIGLAAQQFTFGDFRPVIVPPYESWTAGKAICAYIFSTGIVVASLAIIAEKKARTISLLFGGIMLLLFVFLLAPYQVAIGQTSVGAFTSPLKGLAISGCYFIIAGSFSRGYSGGKLTRLLEKLIPAGPVFFSITMIVFGVAHFLYPGFVASLVPNWIPGHIAWTYIAGVALIAAGVSIILRVQARLAANLLGIAIFVWFLVLHIPRGIADPHSGEGNELASVFEALAFSGICFIMGANLPKSWKAAPVKNNLYQAREYTA